MQIVTSPFAGGTVAVVCGDFPRWHEFYTSQERLLVPENSAWKKVTGNGFAGLRNIAVREMAPDSEWLWFIDDDHPFNPDTLLKLLARNVDIVQTLVLTRVPPFRPYAYKWNGEEYESYLLSELPTTGLFEVDAVGCGGTLIRRHVLDAVGSPWFEEGKTWADSIGEDLHFCTKARELGFKSYVDCDTRMGHMVKGAIWPFVENGENVPLLKLHSAGVILPVTLGEEETS